MRIAAVLVVSTALLAYEVTLMRLLAIVQWSHLAYLVISVALLGFGVSGTLTALGGERLRRREAAAFPLLAGLFAAAMPLATRLALNLDLNVLEIPWRPGEAWRLAALTLVLMVPFLLGASAVAAALYAAPERASRLYAANLAGSGAGAFGAVILLERLRPERIRSSASPASVAAAPAHSSPSPSSCFWRSSSWVKPHAPSPSPCPIPSRPCR